MATFVSPSAEVAVDPAGDNGKRTVYLVYDDAAATLQTFALWRNAGEGIGSIRTFFIPTVFARALLCESCNCGFRQQGKI
jgi:hypothetical protein